MKKIILILFFVSLIMYSCPKDQDTSTSDCDCFNTESTE